MEQVNSILAHAMEDLNISTEHLSAHNALHDAVLQLIYVKTLDIPQGILHYDPNSQGEVVILSYILLF